MIQTENKITPHASYEQQAFLRSRPKGPQVGSMRWTIAQDLKVRRYPEAWRRCLFVSNGGSLRDAASSRSSSTCFWSLLLVFFRPSLRPALGAAEGVLGGAERSCYYTLDSTAVALQICS